MGGGGWSRPDRELLAHRARQRLHRAAREHLPPQPCAPLRWLQTPADCPSILARSVRGVFHDVHFYIEEYLYERQESASLLLKKGCGIWEDELAARQVDAVLDLLRPHILGLGRAMHPDERTARLTAAVGVLARGCIRCCVDVLQRSPAALLRQFLGQLRHGECSLGAEPASQNTPTRSRPSLQSEPG